MQKQGVKFVKSIQIWPKMTKMPFFAHWKSTENVIPWVWGPNHELVDVDGVISIHVQDIKQGPSLAPGISDWLRHPGMSRDGRSYTSGKLESSSCFPLFHVVPGSNQNNETLKFNKQNQRATLKNWASEVKSVHLFHGTCINLHELPQCGKPVNPNKLLKMIMIGFTHWTFCW